MNQTSHVFHASWSPPIVVGRETEQQRIQDVIQSAITENRGGAIYVIGSPGTGKTLVTARLVSSLPSSTRLSSPHGSKRQGTHKSTLVRTAMVNVMGPLKEKNNLYATLTALLSTHPSRGSSSSSTLSSQQSYDGAKAESELVSGIPPGVTTSSTSEECFHDLVCSPSQSASSSSSTASRRTSSSSSTSSLSSPSPSGPMYLVLIDEADVLDHAVLARLIDIALSPSSRLILISIANDISLTEKVRPLLSPVTKNLLTEDKYLSVVLFKRYTASQLARILEQRVECLSKAVSQSLPTVAENNTIGDATQASNDGDDNKDNADDKGDTKGQGKGKKRTTTKSTVKEEETETKLGKRKCADDSENNSNNSNTKAKRSRVSNVGLGSNDAEEREEKEANNIKPENDSECEEKGTSKSAGHSVELGPVLDSLAVQLCASHVASRSGDVRECLDLCRQCLLVSEYTSSSSSPSSSTRIKESGDEADKKEDDEGDNMEEGNKTLKTKPLSTTTSSSLSTALSSQTPLVNIPRITKDIMQQVLTRSVASPAVGRLRSLPSQQQAILCLLAKAAESKPGEPLFLEAVEKRCAAYLDSLKLPSVGTSGISDILQLVEVRFSPTVPTMYTYIQTN